MPVVFCIRRRRPKIKIRSVAYLLSFVSDVVVRCRCPCVVVIFVTGDGGGDAGAVPLLVLFFKILCCHFGAGASAGAGTVAVVGGVTLFDVVVDVVVIFAVVWTL